MTTHLYHNMTTELKQSYNQRLSRLPTKFQFIWLSSFRENFQKSTNLKQELTVAAMFVNRSGPNEQSLWRTFHRCFLPSFGSFGKAVSEEKIFRNRPIRNKNWLLRTCLLTIWEEMSNLYREPSNDASYQISVHLGKRFQRRSFRNKPIRNKNCLWRPCLLMNRDKMSNLYREPSIDASYQVSFIWLRGFRGED